MIWQTLRNHQDDSYFWVVNVSGITSVNRNKWGYFLLNDPFHPDSGESPVPLPLTSLNYFVLKNIETIKGKHDNDSDCTSRKVIDPAIEMNNLVRDLNLSKDAF